MSQLVPSTLLGPPPFVDREDQLGRISRHIADLRGDSTHFKVIEVLGLGGMGKTSLLEELWTRALEMGQGDHLVWIALEGEASTSSTGPLLSMRDQIDCLCLLFDTAILAYWSAMGQPLQLGRSGRLADSLPVKALELGSGLAGFALPVGFGMRVFDSLRGARRKRLHYTPEEFEEIERLHKRPGELLERLPYYLGVDVRRSIDESGGSFVAFYDAYDRQTILTRQAKAPWIQEFIGTLDLGVHVISSREPLDWDERRWSGILEAIPIDALPSNHARALLSASVGQLDRDIEDRLIAAARRVPFLLSTVISAYAELTRRGEEISLERLPASPDSAVAHFLEHLPDAQRDLAIALAAVQVFDERLFRCVVVELNIQVSFPAFHEFVDWYFVESISGDIYKTHDLLTAFVRESPAAESVRVAALEAATRGLFERCGSGSGTVNPDDLLPILRAVVVGWYSTEDVGTSSIEALVDVGFSLYDAGYWTELASLGSEGELGGGHPIDILLEFFHALTARRILGVEPALDRFAALLPRARLLGQRELGVDLEATYVIGLAGNYREARKGFRRVADSFSRLDPSDRTQVRARMYQGGMLLMDGEFRRSSALLAETYDAIDPDESSDWGS